jgi:hypothetical protein
MMVTIPCCALLRLSDPASPASWSLASTRPRRPLGCHRNDVPQTAPIVRSAAAEYRIAASSTASSESGIMNLRPDGTGDGQSALVVSAALLRVAITGIQERERALVRVRRRRARGSLETGPACRLSRTRRITSRVAAGHQSGQYSATTTCAAGMSTAAVQPWSGTLSSSRHNGAVSRS